MIFSKHSPVVQNTLRWNAKGAPSSDHEKAFFFLAHGCHSALDAPKKVDAVKVDEASRRSALHFPPARRLRGSWLSPL